MLYDLQSGSKECQGSSGDTFGGGNICEFRQSLMDDDEGMKEKDVHEQRVFCMVHLVHQDEELFRGDDKNLLFL